MINKKKDENMLSGDEKKFAELFYEALQDKGWTIPKTIEEVKKAEESGVEINFSDLPTHLQNPAEILQQKREFSLKLIPIVDENDSVENLLIAKRAARFGKEISSEVEEKMRLDREKAEREAVSKNNSV